MAGAGNHVLHRFLVLDAEYEIVEKASWFKWLFFNDRFAVDCIEGMKGFCFLYVI